MINFFGHSILNRILKCKIKGNGQGKKKKKKLNWHKNSYKKELPPTTTNLQLSDWWDTFKVNLYLNEYFAQVIHFQLICRIQLLHKNWSDKTQMGFSHYITFVLPKQSIYHVSFLSTQKYTLIFIPSQVNLCFNKARLSRYLHKHALQYVSDQERKPHQPWVTGQEQISVWWWRCSGCCVAW